MTPREARRLAEAIVDRRTKNMVSDAMTLARWVLETVPDVPAVDPDEAPETSPDGRLR